ncbi:MAG TPA: DEAD/DEAH box helicase [Candidatus Woesearchaeota archaeon]|nr:DEAD/DEAH box helicase [Candidatus Woesearchaeota archaeon]
MKISELKGRVPEKLYEGLVAHGLDELRPPQAMAIENGLLERKNIVVSSPTSSGKSLVAEIACIKNIVEGKGKAVYVVPLKALASEKYKEFIKKYPFVKTALTIGDYDSDDRWLANYDLVITTSEKMDSLIRHSVPWLSCIGTLVVDEVHMIDDPHRGPTLEVLITRLRNFLNSCQIVALSATINNAKEISDWLGGVLIKSDYRPVELKEGVYFNGVVDFNGIVENVGEKSAVPEIHLIKDTIAKHKSALVFVSSRRNAEGLAKKAGPAVGNMIGAEEKVQLEKLSRQILKVLETPTKQCQTVAECVKNGVTFHHAGIVAKQRELIEDAFRNRLIKIICCTPTMAAGINVPAFRCIVRDLKRYGGGYMDWIPVLEYKQYVGRAGRPGLEDLGEGITIAKSESDKETIKEKYIDGEPEEIFSKLSAEPILRMHALGLIASGEINSFDRLVDFFSKTFFAFQYQDISRIKYKLEKVVDELFEFGFIKKEVKMILPTLIGKRVAELYIDPYSAYNMLENLNKSNQKPMYYLQTMCSCFEMYPLLRIKSSELEVFNNKFFDFEEELPEVPSPWDTEYERFVNAFKTSLLFLDWINENGEDVLYEKYGETPGALRNHLYIADWLVYAMEELAKLQGNKKDLTPLRKLRTQIKYGVKEELLNLLRFEGVGRIRARKMYDAKIRTVADIRKAPAEHLAKIVGKKTSEKLKKQVVSGTDEQKLLM